MSYNWDVGPKNAIRKELMQQIRKKKPAGVALFLPSNTCLCVEEALKAGVIDVWTQLVVVERDKECLKEMEENLQKLGIISYTIVRKELIKTKVEDLTVYGLFDLAYLDTCCHMAPSMHAWIKNVYVKIIHGNAVSAFTFVNSDRNSWYKDADLKGLAESFDKNEVLDYADSEYTLYNFSQLIDTELNAKELVSIVQKIMPMNVKYGRAYKNSDGKSSPMLTFAMGRRQPKQKRHTGSKKTFDLGYVNG